MAIGDTLYIADKSTLDLVKTAIDATNPRNYTAFYQEVNGTTVATIGTWNTAVSISGKGYLRFALGYNGNNSSTDLIRITVDGTVIYLGRTGAGGTSLTGIANPKEVYMRNTTPVYSVNGLDIAITSLSRKVQLNDTTIGCALLRDNVYFNTSVLVEYMASSTSAKNYVYVGGGVI